MTLTARRQRIEQLAQLLDGDLGADHARADVRHLAALATRVGADADLAPAPLEAEARDRIRERVLAGVHLDAVGADAGPVTRPTRSSRSPRMVVATGLASVLVATSGVTVAAQEALPGDALFAVKQATESVRVAVAGDLTEVGRLELALARERLEDIAATTERRTVQPSVLVDALEGMDVRSADGVEALARVADRSDRVELAVEAARFTDTQSARLSELYDELPVTVRPHAEDSLAELERLREQLLDPLFVDCARCTDLLRAGSVTGRTEPLTGTPLPPAPADTEDRAPAEDQDEDDEQGGDTDAATPPPSGGSSDGSSDPAPSLSEPDLDIDTETGSGDDGLVPELPDPLDDVGDVVDDTVDDVGDTVGDVGDTVDDVGDTVGDVGDTVEDTIEDPAGTVDDLVEDPGGTVDDTVGDVTDGLGDVTDGLGDVTDGLGDVTDGLGDVLGSITGSLGDLLAPDRRG